MTREDAEEIIKDIKNVVIKLVTSKGDAEILTDCVITLEYVMTQIAHCAKLLTY